MKNLVTTILLLFIFFTIIGCEKDNNEFIQTGVEKVTRSGTVPLDTVWEDEALSLIVPTDPTKLFSIEKMNTSLIKPLHIDSFIAENGGKIVTKEGDIVEFPANCCTGVNGVCKGKLEVNFVVLRTKGELIGNDKPTVSNGKLLISGGVVYINVKQNGIPVKLISNKYVTIKYKMQPVDASMKFFEGRGLDRFRFDWAQVNSGDTGIRPWNDSSSTNASGYQIFTDRFGWINCDKFSDEPNLTDNLAITMPDTFTNRNTSIFLVFTDINSVIKLSGDPTTRRFTIPKGYKGIPVGKRGVLLAYANVNNKTYFDIKDMTISQANSYRMIPQAVGLEEIKKKIQGL